MQYKGTGKMKAIYWKTVEGCFRSDSGVRHLWERCSSEAWFRLGGMDVGEGIISIDREEERIIR